MTNAEFQAVFDEHKDAVYRFAWRMSGSPAAAADIVFVAFLRHPGRFDAARGTLRLLPGSPGTSRLVPRSAPLPSPA